MAAGIRNDKHQRDPLELCVIEVCPAICVFPEYAGEGGVLAIGDSVVVTVDHNDGVVVNSRLLQIVEKL